MFFLNFQEFHFEGRPHLGNNFKGDDFEGRPHLGNAKLEFEGRPHLGNRDHFPDDAFQKRSKSKRIFF
jgi:hypothetical protein